METVNHYKVLSLPVVGVPNSIYFLYVDDNTAEEYITDKDGKYKSIVKHGGLSIENFVSKERPTGLINSINKTFTLQYTIIPGTEHVFVNGILQEIVEDYNVVTDNTIVFFPETTPLAGFKLRISYFKQ